MAESKPTSNPWACSHFFTEGLMDITKMSPDQVANLARNAAPANRMAFNAHDLLAVLAFEAEKLVKAREAVAAGQPLPPPHLILAVVTRMRDLAATIMTQCAQPQTAQSQGAPMIGANSN